jgi:demethylmenaquinone methyltransferase/2-methoxy-6-polyprenyl-1,4-benzoquinol methylase
VSKANLDKQPEQVAKMFDDVATKYDITNDLLSLGQSRVWRKKVAKFIDAKSGQSILDLAAGTGASSIAFKGDGVRVVAADFSNGMLAVGRTRHPELEFVFADATNLPFADNEFDVTTISFGLRNVVDVDKALKEMLRVTKPGGRLVVFEFSRVAVPGFRQLYEFYLTKVLPVFSGLSTSATSAYGYLAESIMAWPNQVDLALKIENAGWSEVGYKNFTGGIVALHSGVKAAK